MNQLGLVEAPMREKYWHERTADEKIEVLAELLADAHREIRTLRDRLDDLNGHEHAKSTGRVLVAPRDQYGYHRAGPIGYCREEFMLGRAPREQYQSIATPAYQFAGGQNACGAAPVQPHAPDPTPDPEGRPAEGSDSVKSDATPGIFPDPE